MEKHCGNESELLREQRFFMKKNLFRKHCKTCSICKHLLYVVYVGYIQYSTCVYASLHTMKSSDQAHKTPALYSNLKHTKFHKKYILYISYIYIYLSIKKCRILQIGIPSAAWECLCSAQISRLAAFVLLFRQSRWGKLATTTICFHLK